MHVVQNHFIRILILLTPVIPYASELLWGIFVYINIDRHVYSLADSDIQYNVSRDGWRQMSTFRSLHGCR